MQVRLWIALHLFGIVLWGAGLLAAALALGRAGRETADAAGAVAELAKKSLRMIADPGALLAIATGIAILAPNASYYLAARWMQVKLVFVAGLIALHMRIGLRARALAAAPGEAAPRALLLFAAVAANLLLIIFATILGAAFLP
jgi:uncharacterized membrane protein